VKRAFRWLLLLVTVASATAVWRFTRPEPVTVSLYRLTRGPVASTVANTPVGTVKACRRSNVAPATGGQVARLNVAEGSRVKKDQILLEIWNDDLRAELALAEAELIAAKARAKRKRGLTPFRFFRFLFAFRVMEQTRAFVGHTIAGIVQTPKGAAHDLEG
jgi:HlyD family secretion protein